MVTWNGYSLTSAFVKREKGTRFPGRTFEHEVGNSRGLWQRMALQSLLVGHRGCVNHVEFNDQGTLMASGSDDLRLCLWDLQSSKPVTTIATGHSQNIFCARFMPTTGGSSQPLVATCAGDGEIRLHDMYTGCKSVYNHHMSRVKKLVTEPGNPNLLISCSEDGTVRQIDIRQPGRNATQLLQLARNGVKLEINSISAPWHKPWLLAVGASDDLLRIFDRRTAGTTSGSRPRVTGPKCVSHFTPATHSEHFYSDCITGVSFADDGSQVLANYLGDHVYLWSVNGSSSKPTNLGQQQYAAAAGAAGRKCKRSRQDDDSAPTAAAAAGTSQQDLALDPPAPVAAAGCNGCNTGNAAAPVSGSDQDDGSVSDDDDGAAAAPAGRVLGVDAAVELLERGELRTPRRRRGALASMVLNRSQDLFERGELVASLRYASAALQLRPTFGMAHYQAAICHEHLGDPAAALAAAQAALQYAWGYDLQQFVRRLTRNMQAAAAAEDAEQQQQQQVGQEELEQQVLQQQQDLTHEAPEQQQQQQVGQQPLPPALVQRLQSRGIIISETAAAADDDPGSSTAAAADQDAAGDQGTHAVYAAAAATADGNASGSDASDVVAAAAEVASGGSESWAPTSSGGTSSSLGASSSEGTTDSSSSSGSEGESSQEYSDAHGSSELSQSENDSDHYMLGTVMISEHSSDHTGSSEQTSSSSSSSSSEDSGSSSSDGDSGPESMSDEFTSASEVSWLSDSDDTSNMDDLQDMLGLDVRHRIYDWGGQDAAAAAGSSDLDQQQQQQSQVIDYQDLEETNNDDRHRFGEFLEPLRHQLVLLRIRRQQREQQRQRQQLETDWNQICWGRLRDLQTLECKVYDSSSQQQQQQDGSGPSCGIDVQGALQQQQGGAHNQSLALALDQVAAAMLSQVQQQQQGQGLLQFRWSDPAQHQQLQCLALAPLPSRQQQQQLLPLQAQQAHVLSVVIGLLDRLPGAEQRKQRLAEVRVAFYRDILQVSQHQQQHTLDHDQSLQAHISRISGLHGAALSVVFGEQLHTYERHLNECRNRDARAGRPVHDYQEFVLSLYKQQQQQQVGCSDQQQQQQQQQQDSGSQLQTNLQTDQLQQQQQQQGPAHSAAAAGGPDHDHVFDPDHSGSESDDDDDLSDIMDEQDLLDERDPLLYELGKLLAAGKHGNSSSSSTNANLQPPAPAAAATAAGTNSSRRRRVGAVLQDSDHTPAAAGVGAGVTGGSGSSSSHWCCRYRGHVSLKTVKDVTFVGPDQTMVAAGSDDGRLYVWDRYTGELITALRADRYVVNCIAGHPNLPMMVSCGIDNTVKLWTPCLNQPRPLDRNMLFSLGYNEIERSAESALMRTGFGDMCKAFSKQRAQQLLRQLTQQQGQTAAAAAAAAALCTQ